MTQPTKAAMEWAQEYFGGCYPISDGAVRAFALYIDEVSAVTKNNDLIVEQFEKQCILGQNWKDRVLSAREHNKRLMLPDEPDPLEELLSQWGLTNALRGECADKFRQTADRLGLEIVVRKKGDGE